MDDPTAIATLIFAAMAGIGSVVRVAQNQRLWRFNKKMYEEKKRRERADFQLAG